MRTETPFRNTSLGAGIRTPSGRADTWKPRTAAESSSNDRRTVTVARTLPLLGKLLCWLGFHDFHVVGKSFVGSRGGVYGY